MPFKPTRLNDEDNAPNRNIAAMNVGRTLREVFGNAGLTVAKPNYGDAFGVVDFESTEPVGEDVIKAAKKELRKWGYDFKVLALPGAKGASTILWERPNDYKLAFDLKL
jgi:hypothetical protein